MWVKEKKYLIIHQVMITKRIKKKQKKGISSNSKIVMICNATHQAQRSVIVAFMFCPNKTIFDMVVCNFHLMICFSQQQKKSILFYLFIYFVCFFSSRENYLPLTYLLSDYYVQKVLLVRREGIQSMIATLFIRGIEFFFQQDLCLVLHIPSIKTNVAIKFPCP